MVAYIAQKVLPLKPKITYCNSGRTAFYFAILDLKPRRIHFPNFVGSVLIDVILKFFPDVSISFYEVKEDLTFDFFEVPADEIVLVIEYFGIPTTNLHKWQTHNLLIDLTHVSEHQWEKYSRFKYFGSLRKMYKIADGGFHSGFQVHEYGEVENIESKLIYSATTWGELQKAEELLDDTFRICDMSSMSLSIFLRSDHEEEALNRLRNWKYLREAFGEKLIDFNFSESVIPYIGHLEFKSRSQREKAFLDLSSINVFGSKHWETPNLVLDRSVSGGANHRFGDRVLNIPLNFHLNDYPIKEMEQVINPRAGNESA